VRRSRLLRSKPLKGGTPIRRRKPLRTSIPIRRRRDRPRRGPRRDRAYRAFVRTLPCAAPGAPAGCGGPIHPHHMGRERGLGQKADDRTCVPLCAHHHIVSWHGGHGPFAGWDRDRRRAWGDELVARVQDQFHLHELAAGDPILLCEPRQGVDMGDESFRSACASAGITKKGEKLARVVWASLDEVFAAAGPVADPWMVMDVVCRLARAKASDVSMARRSKG
jgi:hypothetical protein